jgi:hypothetical protein
LPMRRHDVGMRALLAEHILLMEVSSTNDNREYTNSRMERTYAEDSIRGQQPPSRSRFDRTLCHSSAFTNAAD